jgi:hypothetical protein
VHGVRLVELVAAAHAPDATRNRVWPHLSPRPVSQARLESQCVTKQEFRHESVNRRLAAGTHASAYIDFPRGNTYSPPPAPDRKPLSHGGTTHKPTPSTAMSSHPAPLPPLPLRRPPAARFGASAEITQRSSLRSEERRQIELQAEELIKASEAAARKFELECAEVIRAAKETLTRQQAEPPTTPASDDSLLGPQRPAREDPPMPNDSNS